VNSRCGVTVTAPLRVCIAAHARLNFGLVDPLDRRFYPIDRLARNQRKTVCRRGNGVGSLPEEPRAEAGLEAPRPVENATFFNLISGAIRPDKGRVTARKPGFDPRQSGSHRRLSRHQRGNRGDQICRSASLRKQPDSLRLLIVVGACGALIASLGDLPRSRARTSSGCRRRRS
jgi:hypothetical protein